MERAVSLLAEPTFLHVRSWSTKTRHFRPLMVTRLYTPPLSPNANVKLVKEASSLDGIPFEAGSKSVVTAVGVRE